MKSAFHDLIWALRWALLIASFCLALFSGALWLYLPPLPE